MATQKLQLNISIILTLLIMTFALATCSIETARAANTQPIRTHNLSSFQIATGNSVPAATITLLNSAIHQSTPSGWDFLCVLSIVGAETAVVVTHKIRKKKLLINNSFDLSSFRIRNRSIFSASKNLGIIQKLKRYSVRIFVLASIGVASIVYAVGIASNLFALPIFSAFFFVSYETAHKIAYIAATVGSLSLLSCIIIACQKRKIRLWL